VRLKRATVRHIEAEIYSYWQTLRHIDALRQDIILANSGGSVVTVGRSTPSTSTVERRATRLADSLLLREMERITKAIRTAYERTKDEIRCVIWVKYGLAINWPPPGELVAILRGRNRFDMSAREMANMVGVDESTFYRYRSAFVSAIAEELGWY